MEEQFEQNANTTPKKQQQDWIAALYEWAEAFLIVPIAVVLIFTFGFRTAIVSGDSMNATLVEGERMIVSGTFYNPERGDIVVLTQPTYNNDYMVKRIIATEGQTVDIDFGQGIVYVDGVVLDEPYILEPTHLNFNTEYPVTVEPGHLFVMGDNRNHSNDSRFPLIGQVDERMLMGKVYLRISPFTYFE